MLPVGSTFLIPTPPFYEIKHLFILIAVEQKTNSGLIVNFTTARDGCDRSCVLRPGEHRFLTHESVINYADSKIIDLSVLERALYKNSIKPHDHVSSELLEKVQSFAVESNAIPLKNLKFLSDYMIIK